MYKKMFTCFLLISLSLSVFAGNIEYQKNGERISLNVNDTVALREGDPLLVSWSRFRLFDGPYRYRITNLSPYWCDWFDNDFIFVNHIPAGIYKLELINSRNNFASFTIAVDSRFSGWFVISLVGATLIVFSLGLYLRVVFKRRYAKVSSEVAPVASSHTGVLAADMVKETHSKSKSKKYKKVTVLFADIQGFTKIVEHMNPEQLIDELDKYFIFFDEVVEKFNIEKIKTIGDAYMCAGGLPDKNRTNPVDVVLAGMAMQNYMKSIQHSRANNEFGFWELRVGIHTGSVISGMIGNKKRYFDIWGDSVNIASRMESSGIAGEINITGVTYNLIKDYFVCEYRGKMPIKYKGETDMYFVRGIMPSLSEGGAGRVPNQLFYCRLQQNAFLDMVDYLNDTYPDYCLSDKLFASFLITAETLARSERVSEEELLLIKVTSVFAHPLLLCQSMAASPVDIGLVMKKFRFTRDQINVVDTSTYNVVKGVPANGVIEEIVSDAFYLSLLKKSFLHDFLGEKTEKNPTISSFSRLRTEKMVDSVLHYKPFTASFQHLVEVDALKQMEVIKHFFIFDNRNKQN